MSERLVREEKMCVGLVDMSEQLLRHLLVVYARFHVHLLSHFVGERGTTASSCLIAWRWAFSSAVKLGRSLPGAIGSSSGPNSGPSNWMGSARTAFPFFRGERLRYYLSLGFWRVLGNLLVELLLGVATFFARF